MHSSSAGKFLVASTALAACAALVLPAESAVAASDVPNGATYTPLPAPVYVGAASPVPKEPAAYTPDGMMRAMYDADAANGGTDFWMDRLLARTGPEPAQSVDVLMSRGGAAFMRSYNPATLGLGGQLAYYDALGSGADSIQLDLGSAFAEIPAQRVQMPSHLVSTFANGAGQTVTATKFITANNVVVDELKISSTTAVTVPITARSPLATTASGDELVGRLPAYNNLTTVYPRFSGDGLTATAGALTGSVNVPAGGSVSLKVQLGLVTDEIPASRTEYDTYRAAAPAAAYANQVRTYNAWWADNIPYIDVPNQNLKKAIYYRWWILRFNFLDADMPGNDFQFPTSIEGVLGYNNAIALTVPMFSQDLKYLRTADPSYGSWLSEGEVSGGGAYTDNPGDPANWSNTYTQYTSLSALQSWQLHGGPTSIMAKLGQYAAGDVAGQLTKFDTTHENLLTYDNPALTGNDADAVSFDYRPGVGEQRPETAYVYANAMAGAQAYDLAGNTASGDRLRATAAAVQTAMNAKMWDPTTRQYLSRYPDTGSLNPWREINNYLPFTVGLAPNTDTAKQAFRFWDDPSQFSIFPMYTANQQDKAEAAAKGRPGSNNFSHINSVIQFNLLASALRKYPSQYLTASTLKDAIEWAAWSNYVGGDNRYPDSNEFWSAWNPQTKQIDYRSFIHQTQLGATNYPIIEDVAGLQSRSDNKVEVSPIDIGYDHFAVTDIDYRGSNLSIIWDRDGGHYRSMPQGYSLVVDGKVVATSSKLTRLVYDPTAGTVTADDPTATISNTGASRLVAPAARVISDPATLQTLQKAGIDASTSTGAAVNVAPTATATASYAAAGNPAAAANDGITAVRPFWSDKGSGAAQDWYQLSFPRATTLDDVKLYFYDDQPAAGYAAPVEYQVQALVDGTWKNVAGQTRTPVYPAANYNHAQFAPTTATAFRILMTNPPGTAAGLREVQAFHTGVTVPAAANAAPRVTATVTDGSLNGTTAALAGTVADDGLPSGSVVTTWSTLSGPGDALITNPRALTTSVRVSKTGDYVFRLSVTDGAATTTADVSVTFTATDKGPNLAPLAATSASYTSPWENLSAINSGTDPTSSDPGGAGKAWATWPQSGVQWAELDWATPVHLNAASAYFYDNIGSFSGANQDGVPLPRSWKLQAWNGMAFVDVNGASAYTVNGNAYNDVTFAPLTTTKLRFVLDGGTPAAGVQRGVGLRQVKAFAEEPRSITSPHVPTLQGAVPTLPKTVEAVYADGTRADLPVEWASIDSSQVATGGTSFLVSGSASGTGQLVQATVYVRINSAVTITSLIHGSAFTRVGVAPQLPRTVDAVYNDGSRDNVSTVVVWNPVPPASYAQAGSFDVTGTVEGTSLPATVTVAVSNGDATDATPPTTTAAASPAANGGSGWWKNGPVTVSLTAADTGGSTVGSTTVAIDGGAPAPYSAPIELSTDGKHTLTFFSTDTAGNVEPAKTLAVDIDGTAPTAAISGAPADGTTTTGPVTVAVTGADATSGVATLEYRLDGAEWSNYAGPLKITAVGQHTVSVRSTDVAGNVSPVTARTFSIAAPAATAKTKLTSSAPANAAGWYRQAVTFTVTSPSSSTTAQYRLDGGAWTVATKPVTVSADGEHVLATRLVTVTKKPVSGSDSQVMIRIDRNPPSATIVADDGRSGTPRNPVTLQWETYDSLSGVAALSYTIDGSRAVPTSDEAKVTLSDLGRHTVALTVRDTAGNTRSRTTTVQITADRAPAISIPRTAATGSVISVKLSGFVRYETVAIRLGSQQIAKVNVDTRGDATLSVRLPAAMKSGSYTATATGQTSKLTATSPSITVR